MTDADIIFWTDLKGLPEIEPIKPAIKFLPEWFKNVPLYPPDSNLNPDLHLGTIKQCPGFIDLFKKGFVVPLWCDLYLEIKETEIKWKTPNDKFIFSFHNNVQFKDHLPSHAQKNVIAVLKTICPWRVRTPPEISLLQLPMLYHYNPHFTVASGIVDTDIYHEINQQMIFHKIENIKIKRGTPLCMYIPFRREEFNYIVRETNSTDEKIQNKHFFDASSTFSGFYQQRQKGNK